MKKDRKNIILQSLASLLEERNLSKITTAALAEKSQITEAALYRHFPSKRSIYAELFSCLLYTSPSPRDKTVSRMPSSA